MVDGKGIPAAPTTAFSLGNGPSPFNNPLLFVIGGGGMGLRPTFEDENGFDSATSLSEPPPSPLSSAKPRDLQFH
ncbi:MAG: hypothetical protein QOJ51_6297 [Acidobacteriaceae bacterium]|nr:hypothetical protein [Acidobacteriaceae bacterium]